MNDQEIGLLEASVSQMWDVQVRKHKTTAVLCLERLYTRMRRGNLAGSEEEVSQIMAVVLAHAKANGYTLVSSVNAAYHGDPRTYLVFNYRKPKAS
ncbi:hypothetical protein AHIS2_p078 [Acaryochloris phage A-HIS2]|nr:hypothetical protein AHIS2_p078 [Acaryochloris phage A-HIS2]